MCFVLLVGLYTCRLHGLDGTVDFDRADHSLRLCVSIHARSRAHRTGVVGLCVCERLEGRVIIDLD